MKIGKLLLVAVLYIGVAAAIGYRQHHLFPPIPEGKLNAKIAVVKDGIVLMNFDTFDYKGLEISISYDGDTREVILPEVKPETAEALPLSRFIDPVMGPLSGPVEEVSLAMMKNKWFYYARWDIRVEGNNENSRRQRQQTMAELLPRALDASLKLNLTPSTDEPLK